MPRSGWFAHPALHTFSWPPLCVRLDTRLWGISALELSPSPHTCVHLAVTSWMSPLSSSPPCSEEGGDGLGFQTGGSADILSSLNSDLSVDETCVLCADTGIFTGLSHLFFLSIEIGVKRLKLRWVQAFASVRTNPANSEKGEKLTRWSRLYFEPKYIHCSWMLCGSFSMIGLTPLEVSKYDRPGREPSLFCVFQL